MKMMHYEVRQRFEEMGVPAPYDLPLDMAEVILNGLTQGRTLMITSRKTAWGVVQNDWAFLQEPQEARR
jgi:hypothetical protein